MYKGNIIKNLIMDCQSYTKYRPNETMAGTLGVSTMSYLPFAMFCWLCPVLAIVYGFTGKFFWKTGEKSSQKVYQFSTLMEAS